MRILLIKLSMVNIGFLDNIHDANNAWRFGIGMVEECLLPNLGVENLPLVKRLFNTLSTHFSDQ